MVLNIEVFGKIAEALIADYERVYRVNTKTNEYWRYIIDPNSHSLGEEQKGDDFFRDIAEYIVPMVYEEDKHFFQAADLREKFLNQFKNGGRYLYIVL